MDVLVCGSTTLAMVKPIIKEICIPTICKMESVMVKKSPATKPMSNSPTIANERLSNVGVTCKGVKSGYKKITIKKVIEVLIVRGIFA